MRAIIITLISTLVLGLVCGPVLSQTQQADIPGFETIRMFDALTGWAVTNEQLAERFLRTTDGGIHWRDVTPVYFTPQGNGIVPPYLVAHGLIFWLLLLARQ